MNLPVTSQTSGALGRIKSMTLQLETQVAFELIKCARIGTSQDFLNGGVGEQQFASFLQREYAKKLAESNALGVLQMLSKPPKR